VRHGKRVAPTHRPIAKPTIALLILLAATQVSGAEQVSADQGRAIAERWCAMCHAITPGRRSHALEAPSFMRMAADSELGREALRQLIRLPHYEMPQQSLTTPEIEDVIDYILSLRR
jgi:cytochrome c